MLSIVKSVLKRDFKVQNLLVIGQKPKISYEKVTIGQCLKTFEPSQNILVLTHIYFGHSIVKNQKKSCENTNSN